MVLYNILLLTGLVTLGPLWLVQRLILGKSLEGLWERLGRLPGALDGSSHPVWIHAVSVGEVLAAMPVISGIKARWPHQPVVVSTVTPTGRRMAQERLPQVGAVFYLPLDLPGVVQRVIRRVRPCLFVSVETEIWPNLLATLQGQGIPTGVINARLSHRSFRGYRALHWFLGGLFQNLRFMAVQTARDQERALALGVPPERVKVTGNVKADSPFPDSLEDETVLKDRAGLAHEGRVWVAGSTHAGEEVVVAQVYTALLKRFPDLRLVLAPRHPERIQEVEQLLRAMGLPSRRWSEGTGGDPAVVLVVDTLGELRRIYGLATVAFVGGSLVPVGGHNLLEPAAWGKPVLFGPHMDHQHEMARVLLEGGGGRQVHDAQGLLEALGAFLDDSTLAETTGQQARQVVEASRGAVARTVALMEKALDERAPAP